MSLPLEWTGPGSAIALGALFGLILQRAGLGDGCKLTAQLRLEDWTVFDVMFTAILVAACGLWLLDASGQLPAARTYVPPAVLTPALAGGALVALGMSVGGYCPGTSVVALAGGRIDGLLFLLGLVAGTLLFAHVFDHIRPWIEGAAELPSATLPQLLHLPAWLVILVLGAIATAVHALVARREARAAATPFGKVTP